MEYCEPGHSAIGRCDRSYAHVGPVGPGPQPDTKVLPTASTVASQTLPPAKDAEWGEKASILWPLGSM